MALFRCSWDNLYVFLHPPCHQNSGCYKVFKHTLTFNTFTLIRMNGVLLVGRNSCLICCTVLYIYLIRIQDFPYYLGVFVMNWLVMSDIV
jgi:hypothetical protein